MDKQNNKFKNKINRYLTISTIVFLFLNIIISVIDIFYYEYKFYISFVPILLLTLLIIGSMGYFNFVYFKKNGFDSKSFEDYLNLDTILYSILMIVSLALINFKFYSLMLVIINIIFFVYLSFSYNFRMNILLSEISINDGEENETFENN